MKTVILVTGTPGVGKTTVSQKLATMLDAKYVGITELVKTENLVTSKDNKRDTLVADTQKVTERLQQIIADTQNSIVIDGHYATDVVPKQNVNTVFVLRRHPTDLKKVLETRGYSQNKIWENVEAEILDVCSWDAITACGINNVHEINVTEKTAEQVVEEMMHVIKKEQDPKVGVVDWIGKLEDDGQLENYMKQIILTKQT